MPYEYLKKRFYSDKFFPDFSAKPPEFQILTFFHTINLQPKIKKCCLFAIFTPSTQNSTPIFLLRKYI